MVYETVKTDSAPQPVGPYSQAVETSNFVFTSGQIGVDPLTNTLRDGVKEQTRQTMENLKAVLEAAGLAFSNVVKASIFITDMADFAQVNEVYASYFVSPFPARCCVEVQAMAMGAGVEIDLVAIKS
ncbi:MAG: 2-iminobutanoate/2-iminopropanoate deaminase [Desulforhopalus sp.]|jgi:2-iminobutanoate/2-iminopropanoate deaminase